MFLRRKCSKYYQKQKVSINPIKQSEHKIPILAHGSPFEISLAKVVYLLKCIFIWGCIITVFLVVLVWKVEFWLPGVTKLPEDLEPFVTKSVPKDKTKGIVMCVGSRTHGLMARTLMQHIRLTLDIWLPIEVFHVGNEITSGMVERLEACPGLVTVKDLAVELSYPESINWFRGYGCKPMAILHCSFSDIILVDVDVIPLFELNELFESEAYKKHGVILFRDRYTGNKQNRKCSSPDPGPRSLPDGRTVCDGECRKCADSRTSFQSTTNFLRGLIDKYYKDGSPSAKINAIEAAKKLPFFTEESYDVGESSLVVWNRQQGATDALMWLHKLDVRTRDKLYEEYFLGDKEIYWIAFALSGKTPFFNQYLPSAIEIGNKLLSRWRSTTMLIQYGTFRTSAPEMIYLNGLKHWQQLLWNFRHRELVSWKELQELKKSSESINWEYSFGLASQKMQAYVAILLREFNSETTNFWRFLSKLWPVSGELVYSNR